MKKVAIVYHSGYGHTEAQAEHVFKGAKSVAGVKAEIFRVEELKDPTDLNDFDAIIFGAPTYMGSLSAPFKAFMDSTSKLWMKQQWKDKIAAGFTNSLSLSGDKFNSLVQLVTFASQHGMIWVSLGELNHSVGEGKISGDSQYVNRIGSFIGAIAQSDHNSKEPAKGDLKTAEILGARIAEMAKRFS